MWAVWASLWLVMASDDAPQELMAQRLEQYLSLDTINTSEPVIKFWIGEAANANLRSIRWTLDPQEKCVHFMAYLPATTDHPADPFLMIHDFSDVVDSPKTPVWKKTDYGWRMQSKALLGSRLTGVIQWEVLLSLKNSERIRDLFFVATCGDHPKNPYGVQALLKYFIKGTVEDTEALSTLKKIELANIHDMFDHRLPLVGLVWNSGLPGIEFEGVRKISAISNAQKGFWKARLKLLGTSSVEDLVLFSHSLLQKNKRWIRYLHATHSEMVEFAKRQSQRLSWPEQFLVRYYPRYFYWRTDQEDLVDNQWKILGLDNDAATLSYSFIGELTEFETKGLLQEALRKFFGARASYQLETLEFTPFRRTKLEEPFQVAFKHIFEQSKDLSYSQFIRSDFTLSRFFRAVEIGVFDWTPLFFENKKTPSLSPEKLRQSVQLARELFLQRGMLQ